jgi:hypothetical protein
VDLHSLSHSALSSQLVCPEWAALFGYCSSYEQKNGGGAEC